MFVYCLNTPVATEDSDGFISYSSVDEENNNNNNPLDDVARMGNAVTKKITNIPQVAEYWNKGTFQSGYDSMMYHYDKHVVSQGLSDVIDVITYTLDALNFMYRNSSVLAYTYNYKYDNASWNYYYVGQGGMFTSDGQIITFWYGDGG